MTNNLVQSTIQLRDENKTGKLFFNLLYIFLLITNCIIILTGPTSKLATAVCLT